MMFDDRAAPLSGLQIVTLAINLPGPAAAARLRSLGATVMKVEPPAGDPMALYSAAWYKALCAGQQVVRLDLKNQADRATVYAALQDADLLLTAQRPAALGRLGLDRATLEQRFPRLVHVAIVGHPAPYIDVPGHDLSYQAAAGLVVPPALPRTLLADLAGAEQAVTLALALLLRRVQSNSGGYAEVALAHAADVFADPVRYGLTASTGILGGALPGYNLYRTQTDWIAVAALESHFLGRLEGALGIKDASYATLEQIFGSRSAEEWTDWAAEHDLPITMVRSLP
ncbi:MAG: CoA transferase [Herpetosiphon sp.]